MESDKINDFLFVKNKHSIDHQLSLAELQTIKELGFKNIKDSMEILNLILEYCKNPQFQIRMCEKSFLTTNIIPLLALDNEVKTIQYGILCLAYLSGNEETHEKIIKASVTLPLHNVLKNYVNTTIVSHCLEIFSNLIHNVKYHLQFLKTGMLSSLFEKYLDSTCHDYKFHVLKILINFATPHQESNHYLAAQKYIMKKNQLTIIFKCLDENDQVLQRTLELVHILIQNHHNIVKFLNLNLHKRLKNLYNIYKSSQNLKILRTILFIFEIISENRECIDSQILTKDKYLKIFMEFIHLKNEAFNLQVLSIELSQYILKGAKILCNLSQNIKSHDILIEHRALEIMSFKLKWDKNIFMIRTASKFLANMSWNPKHSQLFIQQGIINILLGSIISKDKETLTQSVISLSNLSANRNFHKHAKDINLKTLIFVLDSDQSGDLKVLQAATNTLANISSDQLYHQSILREPELTILLDLLKKNIDQALTKSLIIILSNICTNLNEQICEILIAKGMPQLILQFLKDSQGELLGYLSKIIGGLAQHQFCRNLISRHQIIRYLIGEMQKNEKDVTKQIFLSLITMMFHTDELHQDFLEYGGINLLIIFLEKQNDINCQYLACKCLAYLSHYENNIKFISIKKIQNLIVQNAYESDTRLLKEVLSYFLNLYLHGKAYNFQNNAIQIKASYLEYLQQLCQLISYALEVKNDSDLFKLCIFIIMIISENTKAHETIFNDQQLIQNLSTRNQESIILNDEMFCTTIMNFALNKDNIKILLKLKFMKIFAIMIAQVNQNCYSYISMFLTLVIWQFNFFIFNWQYQARNCMKTFFNRMVIIFCYSYQSKIKNIYFMKFYKPQKQIFNKQFINVSYQYQYLCGAKIELPKEIQETIYYIAKFIPSEITIHNFNQIVLQMQILKFFSSNENVQLQIQNKQYFIDSPIIELINKLLNLLDGQNNESQYNSNEIMYEFGEILVNISKFTELLPQILTLNKLENILNYPFNFIVLILYKLLITIIKDPLVNIQNQNLLIIIKLITNLSTQIEFQLSILNPDTIKHLVEILNEVLKLKSLERNQDNYENKEQLSHNSEQNLQKAKKIDLIQSILACIINLSQKNFCIVQELVALEIVQTIYSLMRRYKNNSISYLSMLLLSNIMINKENIKKYKFQILLIIKHFEKFYFANKDFAENIIKMPQLFTAFYKYFYNCIQSKKSLIKQQICTKITDQSLSIFNLIDNSPSQTLILSIVNSILDKPFIYDNFKQKHNVITKVFQIMHFAFQQAQSGDSSGSQKTPKYYIQPTLLESVITNVRKISSNETNISFYQSYMKMDTFFNLFKAFYNKMEAEGNQIILNNLLMILENLTRLKESFNYIQKNSQILDIFKDIYLEQIQLLQNNLVTDSFLQNNIGIILNIFENLSSIPDLQNVVVESNFFLGVCNNITKLNKLNQIIFQCIIVNLSFNFEYHSFIFEKFFSYLIEDFRKINNAINLNNPMGTSKIKPIRKQLYKKSLKHPVQLCVQLNLISQLSLTIITNLALNPEFYKLMNNFNSENYYIYNFLTKLKLSQMCDYILQIRLLETVVQYLIDQSDKVKNIVLNLDQKQILQSNMVSPAISQLKLQNERINDQVMLPRTQSVYLNTIIDDQQTSNKSLWQIIIENIMEHIIKLILSQSKFVIKNLSMILPAIAKLNRTSTIYFDRYQLMKRIFQIIILYKNHNVKKLFCLAICELSKDVNFYEQAEVIKTLSSLKQFIVEIFLKMIKYKGKMNQYSFLLIFFQKIIQNVAQFGLSFQHICNYYIILNIIYSQKGLLVIMKLNK